VSNAMFILNFKLKQKVNFDVKRYF
jgi:hypothetical protein